MKTLKLFSLALALGTFTIGCADNDSDLEDAAEEVGEGIEEVAEELSE